MLTPERIEELKTAADIITNPLEDYIISDIAAKVATAGRFTSSSSYLIWRLKVLGFNDKKLEKEIIKRLKINEKKYKELIKQAAEESFADDYLRITGKTKALEENKYLTRYLDSVMNIYDAEHKNIVGTMGFIAPDGKFSTLTTAYRQAADYAFNMTSSGLLDYNTAVHNATKQLATRGILTIDYDSGIKTELGAAMRRDVMGGIGKLQEEISNRNAVELGTDGWEISAHFACAPDHEPIQGKRYTNAEYKALNESLQRPIGTLNCGHIAFPVMLEDSKPLYSETELREMAHKNASGFNFEGKDMTEYQGTQLMRKCERKYRQLQRQDLVAKETNEDLHKQLKTKKQALRQKYGQLCKAGGFKPQYDRLRV